MDWMDWMDWMERAVLMYRRHRAVPTLSGTFYAHSEIRDKTRHDHGGFGGSRRSYSTFISYRHLSKTSV
jgi:hypothetical protein